MKKYLVIGLCLVFGVLAYATQVEIRDYGRQATYNMVRIPANTVTTLNLGTANRYFTEIFNWNSPVVWIGHDRTVSENKKGRPIYPSANVGITNTLTWYGIAGAQTTVSVYIEY